MHSVYFQGCHHICLNTVNLELLWWNIYTWVSNNIVGICYWRCSSSLMASRELLVYFLSIGLLFLGCCYGNWSGTVCSMLDLSIIQQLRMEKLRREKRQCSCQRMCYMAYCTILYMRLWAIIQHSTVVWELTQESWAPQPLRDHLCTPAWQIRATEYSCAIPPLITLD